LHEAGLTSVSFFIMVITFASGLRNDPSIPKHTAAVSVSDDLRSCGDLFEHFQQAKHFVTEPAFHGTKWDVPKHTLFTMMAQQLSRHRH